MPLYEHVYLARQDLSQQQVDELTNQYKGVIAQMGGNVSKDYHPFLISHKLLKDFTGNPRL